MRVHCGRLSAADPRPQLVSCALSSGDIHSAGFSAPGSLPDTQDGSTGDRRAVPTEGTTMTTKLELVPDPPARPPLILHRPYRGARTLIRVRRWASARFARFRAEERGAVTAEYAIVILAAVAFAGLLVAILQSSEIRAMLVQLVENALGTGE